MYIICVEVNVVFSREGMQDWYISRYWGYLEEVILIYQDLFILQLISSIYFGVVLHAHFCVNCVYSGLLCYFKDLVHNIQDLQLASIQCRVRKVVCGVIQDLKNLTSCTSIQSIFTMQIRSYVNKDIVLFIKILKFLHCCLFEGVLILFSL